MAQGFLGGVNDTIGAFLTMQQQAARNQIAQQELELARQRGDRDERTLQINEKNYQLNARNADIAQQEADRNQREFNLGLIRTEGDELVGRALAQGWFNPAGREKPFDRNKLYADLNGTDLERKAIARDWVIRAANHERSLSRWEAGDLTTDDFRFDALDEAAFTNGDVLVTGKYRRTGEPGVSTVNGTNRPDDPVLIRNFSDVANDLSLYFNTSVLQRGSNLGRSSAYAQSIVATDLANADAKQGAARLESDVVNGVAAAYGPEQGRAAKRQLIAVLGAAKTPEERLPILLEIAQGLNLRGANILIPRVFQAATSGSQNQAGRPQLRYDDAPQMRTGVQAMVDGLFGTKRGSARTRDQEGIAGLVEPEIGATATRSNIPYVDRRYDSLAAVLLGYDSGDKAGKTARTILTSSPETSRIRAYDAEIEMLKQKANKLDLNSEERLNMEREIASRQRDRNNLVTSRNDRIWEKITSDLNGLYAEREQMSPDRRGPIDSKIAELELRRDRYTAAGYRTPEMVASGYRELEKNVISKIQGMSPTEVADAIDSGAITFSEADMAAMRQYASSANVTSMSSIRRLPNQDQIALRAMLYAWAPDANKPAIRNEMVNLSTTFIPSMSQKDLDESNRAWATIRIQNRNLTLEENKFLDKLKTDSREGRVKDSAAASKFLREFNGFVFRGVGGESGQKLDESGASGSGFTTTAEKTLNFFTGERDLGTVTKDRVINANRLTLGPMILDTRAAIANGGGQYMLQALNSAMSTSLATLAIEGDGSFLGWLGSFGRPDARQVMGSGTDFTLSRFVPEFGKDMEGNPTIKGFWYTDKNRAKAGRFFTAQQVQEELDPEVYEALAEVVMLNQDAKKGR